MFSRQWIASEYLKHDIGNDLGEKKKLSPLVILFSEYWKNLQLRAPYFFRLCVCACVCLHVVTHLKNATAFAFRPNKTFWRHCFFSPAPLPALLSSFFLINNASKASVSSPSEKNEPRSTTVFSFVLVNIFKGAPHKNLNALFLASLSAHSKACTFFGELINMKYCPDYLENAGAALHGWTLYLAPRPKENPSIQFRPRASLLIGPRANSGFVCGRPTLQWVTEREKVASIVPLMSYSCARRCRTASWVDLTTSAKSRSSARTHCHPELIWPTQERTRRCCH